jgi:hypothetical protein
MTGVELLKKLVPLVPPTYDAAREGPMRVVACLEEPAVVARILQQLGLPTEPLPTARAQGPPVTLELFSDP